MDMQKAGMEGSAKLAKYQRLEQLLDGINTGKLTPSMTQVAAVADSLGLQVDKNLGPKQAAEALSNEVALTLRNPSGGAGMPGALSDKDREFLISMTPGLAKTPEGNKLIIQTAKKLAKRDQDVAQKARQYRMKHGQLNEGFYEELKQWVDQNPLFSAGQTPQSPSGPKFLGFE